MKITCKVCGAKKIDLFSKIFMRRNRNVECMECGVQFNYSWGYGILVNMLAAALGSVLIYLILFVDLILAAILWLLIGLGFIVLMMLIAPIKEVRARKFDLGKSNNAS